MKTKKTLKKHTRLFLYLPLFFCSISAFGSSNTNHLQVVVIENVRLLNGPFKTIQELHRTGMVGQLEPDKLLFPFRKNAKLPQPEGVTGSYGGWDDAFITGHYGGHYLTAASRMFAATGDSSFLHKVNYMVSILGECQQALGGGYLSAFPSDWFDKLEKDYKSSLVPYYTIHKIIAGLVDASRYCNNANALKIASNMSDYFAARLAKLSPEQLEAIFRTDYTDNPLNEFGGMAEALSDLYLLAQKQGDPNAIRHLKLAATFNRNWFIHPLLNKEDHLNGLHSNTHTAQACGIARYALAADNTQSFNAADSYWHMITEKHSFCNGGNSFNEKLRQAGTEVAGSGNAALTPLTAEYCNTNNMLKLSKSLFEFQPNAAYADYYEKALFNHILAAIAPDNGKVMYYMSLRPGDYRAHINEPYCCQGTGIENAARFNEGIYFQQDKNLYVNQFIASELKWKEMELTIRQETAYPENGQIRFVISEAANPVYANLHIRIPGWLHKKASIKINGKKWKSELKAGTYAVIEQTWQKGDVIQLELPLELRATQAMDDSTTISYYYGPVLLAGKLGKNNMPASDIGAHNALAKAAAYPVPAVLASNIKQALKMLKPLKGKAMTFIANMKAADNKSVTVELAPFYFVQHQRYAVYWKMKNATKQKK